MNIQHHMNQCHVTIITENMFRCRTGFCDEVVGFRHPTFARLSTQKLRTYIYHNTPPKRV